MISARKLGLAFVEYPTTINFVVGFQQRFLLFTGALTEPTTMVFQSMDWSAEFLL
jgi:hypothetical protein